MTSRTLAPQYDPAAIETDTYRRWMDADAFTARVDSERDPYVIVIPPPNVTASLHMGHGLDNTFQDIFIRFERMRGREAEWLPGTDHAGIATQNVVERQLATEGLSRYDLGRDAFIERVWAHVKETGGTILDQLKAIGASCDWSRTRFTLDDAYSAAVRKVFVQLYDDGLIYRGYRVIHWCPRCLTSLSDEEAEFHDKDAHLYHIRYRRTDDPGQFTVVATTRPETIFADVCLVHHPEDAAHRAWTGATVTIPLTDIAIPIDVSDHVERDFGTGMLKVTPAHDANDFDIANELDRGFDRPVIIDEHGMMADDARVPAPLRGMDRFEARTRVVAMLREADLLDDVQPYQHAVRQCYRCHTVVEPRLSDQWFVRMQPLAEPALAAFREGRVTFVPDRWGKVYENWLSGIRDWNISRQLWWGHRIPAWHCAQPDCDTILVTEGEPGASCPNCQGPLEQDPDVLDTWFSSWLWPFATFGWPDDTPDLRRFYPGHTLVTGPDIIFFWVARMIMAGCYFMGDRPFQTVYLHGMVRDTQHRKMSKSLGNGIDPLQVVDRFGADALRFTVVMNAATGTDVILDPDDLETSFSVGRNFANKVWNAGRFILMNLEGDLTPLHAAPDEQLELADRWILSRADRGIDEVTTLLADFRVNDAGAAIYRFFWDDLADWYIEQVKPRLAGDVTGGDVARGVLVAVFETALRLLHPFMPFITEELWSHLPGDREPLLVRAAWPSAGSHADADAEADFALVQGVVNAVRSIRAEYRVAPGQTVSIVIDPATARARSAIERERHTIERLARLADLSLGTPPDGPGAHEVLPDRSSVFVPLGDAIDVTRECQRLRDERKRLERQLAGVAAKLSNEQFLSRAPEDVVEREREKERSWREKSDALADKLRALGC